VGVVWLVTVASAQEQAAQNGVIQGTVVELGSGLPLPGAVLRVRPSGAPEQVETADERGDFRFVTPAGRVELTISAPEHQDGQFVESLSTGEILDVKYRLERFSWTEEVIVYGETREEVARTVLSIDELRRVPGSFGDPIRALQSLPSVTRGPDLSGDIVARGAEAVNTAAYVDGVRIPFLFHFLVGRSVIDPGLIEDIEFYPGAIPPRYGDVNQAVINARTRFDPAEPGLHGRVHADLLEFGFSAAANLGDDWTLRFAGRRAWVASVVNTGLWVSREVRGQNSPDFRPASLRIPYRDQQVRVVRDFGRDRVSFTALSARDAIEIEPEWIDLDGDGLADPPPTPDLPYDPNLVLDSRFERAQARCPPGGWSAATASRTWCPVSGWSGRPASSSRRSPRGGCRWATTGRTRSTNGSRCTPAASSPCSRG
jgi:TonB-dependent Receptor Plug Domain